MQVVAPASFAPEDVDELVVASFACAWCLGPPDLVEIVENLGGGLARAHCLTCCANTDVTLDYTQLLRVALCPPAQLAVSINRPGPRR